MRKYIIRTVIIIMSFASASMASANVTGNDLQNFNATTSGLDYVTVHSSKTLKPWIFNFGLFTNYAINTLPRYDDESSVSSRLGKIRDSVTASDFNVGLGILENLEVGISFPFVIAQQINSSGPRGEFDETGLTEIRGNIKWRPISTSKGGIATVLSFNQNLVANNPYAGEDAGPTINAELIFDTRFSDTSFAFNIGYRNRSPGNQIEGYPIEPLSSQLIASLAASYLLEAWDTKLIGEIYSGTPLKDSNSGSARSVSAAEMLLGAKYDYTSNLAFHAGLGSSIIYGTASPDLRVYTGVNLTSFRPKSVEPKLSRPKIRKNKPTLPQKKAAPNLPKVPAFAVADNFPPEPEGPGDDVFVLRDINFAFDSDYQVLSGARKSLRQLADHLRANGYKKVIIEGHTDSIGSEAYNLNLGNRRATTIERYLVEVEKLDANRLEAKTYGQYRPIADNGNFQGRQLNRRVVFRVIYR